MTKKQTDCTIIIVNYKVPELVLKSIKTIYDNNKEANFEIIVVDNDEKKVLKEKLERTFTKVIYIPNSNKGFGQANNVGFKKAKGKYLFFLNPDTEVSKDAIEILLSYFKKVKKLGIVAPTLFDKKRQIFPLQGSTTLGVKEGIFALSFINKLFPKNPISRKYWLLDIRRDKDQYVDTVPGTAFMIDKKLYEKINGFDENFFLYFEEFDLCKRVKDLGYKIVISPQAKIMHLWGESTKRSSIDTKKIYFKSQFYYFKKHYGLLNAFLVTLFTKLNLNLAAILAVGIISLILRIYQLDKNMIFIGDQAWYFLSARDLLLNHSFTLVGIPSSHIWISQGAYWTYMLAIVLAIFKFSPLSAGYLSVVIDVLTVCSVYYFGIKFFSKKIGFVAALLYSFSPLLVNLSKMPYHTTPIPILTVIYLYFFAKWISGNYKFFPLLLLVLAILYNFELATFILVFPLVIFLIFGIFKRMEYARKLFNLRYFFYSLFAVLIPLLPFFIYDISNNNSQTAMFVIFLIYKIAVKLGFPQLSRGSAVDYASLVSFFGDKMDQLFLLKLRYLGSIFVIISLVMLTVRASKKRVEAEILLLVIFITSFIAFLFAGVPSDAYLPVFYPIIILIASVIFVKYIKGIAFAVLLTALLLVNTFTIIEQDQQAQYFLRVFNASEEIVSYTKDKEYKILVKGEGAQFQTSTMNYEYLAWWLGHGPSNTSPVRNYIIVEEGKNIIIKPVTLQ